MIELRTADDGDKELAVGPDSDVLNPCLVGEAPDVPNSSRRYRYRGSKVAVRRNDGKDVGDDCPTYPKVIHQVRSPVVSFMEDAINNKFNQLLPLET